MYEILKQYEHMGKRKLSITELRELLCIGSKEYPRWSDFKTYILDSCQKALSEKTDITFTYEPIRTGHKFTAIMFFIRKNENYVDHLKLDDYIQEKKLIEMTNESDLPKKWIPLLLFFSANGSLVQNLLHRILLSVYGYFLLSPACFFPSASISIIT